MGGRWGAGGEPAGGGGAGTAGDGRGGKGQGAHAGGERQERGHASIPDVLVYVPLPGRQAWLTLPHPRPHPHPFPAPAYVRATPPPPPLCPRQARLTLATSHHAELKRAAEQDSRYVNVSMEFDTASLRPTYRCVVVGLGFRVQGVGFGVRRCGARVQGVGLGVRVWGLELGGGVRGSSITKHRSPASRQPLLAACRCSGRIALITVPPTPCFRRPPPLPHIRKPRPRCPPPQPLPVPPHPPVPAPLPRLLCHLQAMLGQRRRLQRARHCLLPRL